MKNKVIFILLDGLSFDAAYIRMGYMLHIAASFTGDVRSQVCPEIKEKL